MAVPSPMIPPLSKEDQRQKLRIARDAYCHGLAPGERERLQADALHRLRSVVGPGQWASYLAIGSEIDPAGLEVGAPCPIAYPWFAGRQAPMLFRLGAGQFVPGPFGIRQPPAAAAEIRPDWIVLPLVGIDPRGNRIGQGAGHYDRALAALRAKKAVTTIGLAWDVQLVDRIEADPWDQPVDLIVTPGRIIEARS